MIARVNRFEDDDNHPPPDTSALITALGNLTELRAMHSDIRCLYCDKPAPPGCGGAHRGRFYHSLSKRVCETLVHTFLSRRV